MATRPRPQQQPPSQPPYQPSTLTATPEDEDWCKKAVEAFGTGNLQWAMAAAMISCAMTLTAIFWLLSSGARIIAPRRRHQEDDLEHS